MAKQEQTPTIQNKTSNLVIIDDKTAKTLLRYNQIKESIDTFAALCEEIEIIDDVTEGKAKEMLSDLNKVVKTIDEKRKQVKARPLAECNAIDAAAKELTALANKAIENGRKRISDYVVEKQEREINEAKKLALQAQTVASAQLQEVAEENNEQTDEVNGLAVLMETATKELFLVKTMDELKVWHAKYSTANGASVLKPEIAPNFTSLFNVARQVCSIMKDLWKDKISGKNPNVKESDVRSALISFEQEMQDTLNVLGTEIANAANVAAAEIQAAAIDVSTAGNYGPSKWDYELADYSKVPEEFKCVDEAAVREYIKKNKCNLAHGEVRFGIRFIREAITRLA